MTSKWMRKRLDKGLRIEGGLTVEIGEYFFDFDLEFYGYLGDPREPFDNDSYEDLVFTLSASSGDGPLTKTELSETEFKWWFGEEEIDKLDLRSMALEQADSLYEDAMENRWENMRDE